MQEKQLNILVRARDEATKVFQGIGQSAGGLSGKLKEQDSLLSQAKGFKSALRSARNLTVALELGPVALQAYSSAMTSLDFSKGKASLDQMVESHKALHQQLADFPIIGKLAGEVSTYLGDRWAALWGKLTDAEQEQAVEKQKQILIDFATTAKKLELELYKSNHEAALIALSPGGVVVERAKQDYETAIRDLKPLQKALMDAQSIDVEQAKRDAVALRQQLKEAVEAGDSGRGDKLRIEAQLVEVGQAIQAPDRAKKLQAEIKQIQDNAAAVRDAKIKAQDTKQLADHAEFFQKYADQDRQAGLRLLAAKDGVASILLEIADRGYAAELTRSRETADRQLADLHFSADKQRDEVAKEIQALADLKAKGDADAIERTKRLNKEIFRIGISEGDEAAAIQKRARTENALTEKNRLHEATLAILRSAADAGDVAAGIEEKRLATAQQELDTANALRTIRDEGSTAEARAQAEKQLVALNANRQLRDLQANQEAATFVLRQQAELGDRVAEKALKRLEIEKEFSAEKAKQLAIVKDELATNEARADAKKILAGLDETEKRAIKNIGKSKNTGNQLAGLEDNFYLSGRQAAAAAKEKDPIQDVVGSTKETTAAVKTLTDLIDRFAKIVENRPSPNVWK